MDGKSFEEHARECGLEDDFGPPDDSGYFGNSLGQYVEQQTEWNGYEEIDCFEGFS